MRGYIGPLGDDIPSIFPIVAGILLLIASMWYANSMLAAKTAYLELRKAAIDLGYLVLDKGLLGENLEEAGRVFDAKCAVAEPQAALRGVAFAFVVKRFCGPINLSAVTLEQLFETYTPHPGRGAPTGAGAPGLEGWRCAPGTVHTTAAELAAIVNRSTFVSVNYPIAIPCPELYGGVERGLGLLSVVVWKPVK